MHYNLVHLSILVCNPDDGSALYNHSYLKYLCGIEPSKQGAISHNAHYSMHVLKFTIEVFLCFFPNLLASNIFHSIENNSQTILNFSQFPLNPSHFVADKDDKNNLEHPGFEPSTLAQKASFRTITPWPIGKVIQTCLIDSIELGQIG